MHLSSDTKVARLFPHKSTFVNTKVGLRFHEREIPQSTEDNGFIDLHYADLSHRVTFYSDDEVSHILAFKCSNDVYDLPIIKMYFYQSRSNTNIEVDLNNPLHKALEWELSFLGREVGTDRQNALARIRRVAKKMGLKTHRGIDNRAILATDLQMVWRDAQGKICG